MFYQRLEDNTMIAVPVATRPTLTVGRPQELFRIAGLLYGVSATSYAVSADGKRWLMTAKEREGPTPPGLSIVLNWVEEFEGECAMTGSKGDRRAQPPQHRPVHAGEADGRTSRGMKDEGDIWVMDVVSDDGR